MKETTEDKIIDALEKIENDLKTLIAYFRWALMEKQADEDEIIGPFDSVEELKNELDFDEDDFIDLAK